MSDKTDSEWTETELRISVEAYLDMSLRIREGQRIVKKSYYRDVSTKIGRSEKSCEYRMQNISFVLYIMGRDWINGLPPAKNVGVNIAAKIEKLICELQNWHEPSRIDEAFAIANARKSLKSPPEGNSSPQKTSSTSTLFIRDIQIKAWVLNRAKGLCEACGQKAPFQGADGYPYLEVHHVKKLSDGGSDKVTNAVALCPNCHRRLHFSEDAHKYRDYLYGKVATLIRE